MLGEGCAGNHQCQSGFCTGGVCCSGLCAGACEACGANGQCGNATGPGSPSCAPYLCLGTSSGCPVSCAADSACATGYYCNGAQCVSKKATGQTCSGANQCQSGFCSDGYCCNQACAGGCDGCSTTAGTCTVVGAGSAGQNPSCAPGVCDGVSGLCPGACGSDASCAAAYYCNASGQCVAQLATGSVCTRARECASGYCVDGYCCSGACGGGCDVCNAPAGSCTVAAVGSPGSPGCGAYVCSGASAACPTSCGSDAGCAAGYYCNAAGACVAAQGQGAGCTRARQCASGYCADGYCCGSGCGGGCDVCHAPARDVHGGGGGGGGGESRVRTLPVRRNQRAVPDELQRRRGLRPGIFLQLGHVRRGAGERGGVRAGAAVRERLLREQRVLPDGVRRGVPELRHGDLHGGGAGGAGGARVRALRVRRDGHDLPGELQRGRAVRGDGILRRGGVRDEEGQRAGVRRRRGVRVGVLRRRGVLRERVHGRV